MGRIKDVKTGRFVRKDRYLCKGCGKSRTKDFCGRCHNKEIREKEPKAYKEYQRIHILRRHGIDAAEYNWLMAVYQQNKCALCGTSLLALPKQQRHLDHAHGCVNINRYGLEYGCPQCIRGVLCGTCNRYRIPGIEFVFEQGLFQHPYLVRRPIVEFREKANEF